MKPPAATVNMSAEIRLPIVEIFASCQGEGYNTGMPAVFVRLGRCNLACPWCDTDYHRYRWQSLAEVLATVAGYGCRNVIITGGEPTLHPQLEALLQALKERGHFLALETNGLRPVSPLFDYVATSPKRFYARQYTARALRRADEVRVVVDGEMGEFCAQLERLIVAPRYYLSPCEVNGQMNLRFTLEQLGALNGRPGGQHWQLSLQTHKLAGIP